MTARGVRECSRMSLDEPRSAGAAAVLVGAVTLVSASVAASAALTPRQYRVQATAICTRMHDQIAGLQYGKVGTRAQMIQYLSAALPAERNYVAALRRLQPPEQLRAMHDGVVSDEAAQLALTIRFLATLKVTRDAGFRVAIERWGASGHHYQQRRKGAPSRLTTTNVRLVARPPRRSHRRQESSP